MGIETLYADGIEQAYRRGLTSPAQPVEPDFRMGSFLAAGLSGIPRGAFEALSSVRDLAASSEQQFRDSPRGRIVAQEYERRTGVKPADQYRMPGGDSMRQAAEYRLGPDPQTAHVADQVFHGLTRFGTKAVGAVAAAGPVGGAALLGAEETNTIYRDLIGRGIDSETALKVAAVQGAISAAGVMLPISAAGLPTAAGKVAGTAALVGVGGPGGYVAQETLARDILQRAGYADEAAKHDPADPLGLAISTILPLAFGGVAVARSMRSTKPMPPVRTEAGVRQAVQLTPEEQAASDAYEASAENLAELRKEIARTKDPAARQVLEAELAKQTQAAATLGQNATAEAAPMPAVYSKDVPPPADGMVRLYRAESPTVRFSDVFDVSQLGQFKRPDGMTGDRYTDEFKLADYYRMSYGRDAVIRYVDVPKESLAGRGGAAGEFFIDTAISIDRRRTAQAAAMSPAVVDAARVKVLQETVSRSLPETPDAYPRLMEAIDAVAAGDRPVVEAITQVQQWQSLADFIDAGKWKAGDAPRPYSAYEGPDGFLGWVRSQGGIALAEKYDITGETNVVRSNPGGIFRGSGLGRDELARRAADAGYMLPDEAGDSSRFVDLLQSALMRGERVLTLEQQTEAAMHSTASRGMDDRITDLEGRLRMLGEDPAAARGNPEAMEAYLQANEARLLAATAEDAAARAGDDSPEMDALRERAQQIAQDIRDTDRTLDQYETELEPLSPVMRSLVREELDAATTPQAANPEAAAPARGAGDEPRPGVPDAGRPAADVQAAGVAAAKTERQIVEALAADRPDMMVTLPGTNEAVPLADALEQIRAQQALDENDAELVRAAVLCDLSP